MNFKVGDRVKIIRSRFDDDKYTVFIGSIDIVVETYLDGFILESDPKIGRAHV